tara:strand:+ start:1342 stop:1992 length:651 start_codon:yes stop_codon:yes gene_type:complete
MNISNWDEWVSLGISLAAVTAGFFTYFINKQIKKRKKAKDIVSPSLDFPEVFWNVHTKIQETITELRLRVDCARTHLVQFHNGGYFLDGISMKRMSLTHESLERSVSGEIKNHQDLVMSMFMPLLENVKNDTATLRYVNEMEDSYPKQHLDSSNVIAFSVLPIRNDNMIVGYIMSQWCSWNKVDSIDEELVEDWMNRSQSLIEVELINQKRKTEYK